MDATGKNVLLIVRQIMSGTNSIKVDNISNLGNGIYTIQVIAGDEIFNQRVVIRH
jgi:hypothetical protein